MLIEVSVVVDVDIPDDKVNNLTEDQKNAIAGKAIEELQFPLQDHQIEPLNK